MKNELLVRIRTYIYWNKIDNHFFIAFKFGVQGLIHSNVITITSTEVLDYIQQNIQETEKWLWGYPSVQLETFGKGSR